MAERGGEGEEIAWTGAVEGDASEEAVEIENALQGASKLFAADEVGAGGFDGGVAGLNGDGVDHGPQERGTEQAFAHRGAAGIHGAEESGIGTGVVEYGLD